MNTFLIILFIIIVLIIIAGIVYVYYYNKINETIIRVDEAETRIDNDLRDKFDLLNRCLSIAKSKIELPPNAFKEIVKLRSRKISNFDLDRVLATSHNEFLSIYEKNKELNTDDELYKISKQIEIINDELVTLRNYYNANISSYNRMIKKFPTNIISEIKKYKEKPYYDLKNRTDDNYEDFKL